MSYAARPDNIPVWAATGDRTNPGNVYIAAGWPASTTPPARQYWNYAMNQMALGVRYYLQQGIPEWAAAEEYQTTAIVKRNGLTYVALTANTNSDPAVPSANWERWGYSASQLSAAFAGTYATQAWVNTNFPDNGELTAILASYVTGAQLTAAVQAAIATASTNREANIVTGSFGSGKTKFIFTTGSFTVPATDIRVRLWSAGNLGGGGGWSIKTITGLTIGATIAVTVAATAGASTSFGAHNSATGGAAASGSTPGAGGVGSGGDTNANGGTGGGVSGSQYFGYGGVGGAFGNGGNGGIASGSQANGGNGNAGGGGSTSTGTQGCGGNGWNGAGAAPGVQNGARGASLSLDAIGTGGGGGGGATTLGGNGNNGGGAGGTVAGTNSYGGFPGGGGPIPGLGLVIVEY